jgi:ubiquinone/menaquinone biosynthesis C-methylase UbiE
MTKRKTYAPCTPGYVLVGLEAKLYDAGNYLFGVPLVVRKHVSIIQMSTGDRLLDVGCGTGETIKRLSTVFGEGVSIHGIDPSPDMLEVAKRKLKRHNNVCIEWGVGERLPFADGVFNWVVNSFTMHHLPIGLKESVAREFRRVLQPRGRCLVTDFGKPTNRLGNFFGRLWGSHAFTHENIQGVVPPIMSRSGFKIVNAEVQAGIIHHILATSIEMRGDRTGARALGKEPEL